MMSHIDMSGINVDLTDDFKKYVMRKVGRMDRFLPRRARQTAHAEVKVREANEAHGNKYECEVILHVPNDTITARESTLNMFAALDIVEQKLKNQLKRYKDSQHPRGILTRFRHRRKNLGIDETVVEKTDF